jgi:hypothetical protein
MGSKGRGKDDEEKNNQDNQRIIMGINSDVPAQIETDDDVQGNERPKPRGAEVQGETDVEEDNKEGDMNKHSRKAVGREALCAGKGPEKVGGISF